MLNANRFSPHFKSAGCVVDERGFEAADGAAPYPLLVAVPPELVIDRGATPQEEELRFSGA